MTGPEIIGVGFLFAVALFGVILPGLILARMDGRI